RDHPRDEGAVPVVVVDVAADEAAGGVDLPFELRVAEIDARVDDRDLDRGEHGQVGRGERNEEDAPAREPAHAPAETGTRSGSDAAAPATSRYSVVAGGATATEKLPSADT